MHGPTELDALEREAGGRVEELAGQLVIHTVLESLLVMTSDKAPPRTWVVLPPGAIRRTVGLGRCGSGFRLVPA
jgi:hypothetical protein